jgi:hypothetical protein
MLRWWSSMVRLMVFILILNGVLYALQHWLGWPSAVRSGGGALLFLLGLFFTGGGAGGGYLLKQAEAKAVTIKDARRYRDERQKNLSLGTRLALTGALTFTLAVLFP